jgi:anaerobic magnesium-protoporphyrin IX monomethyl ester cyclase
MDILILQPPSPPLMNVKRDLAGGMGVADPSKRNRFGHDRNYITMPYSSLLYTAGVLERDGHKVTFVDAQEEDLDKEQVVARVQELRPAVVVQLLNLPSLYGDLAIMKAIREGVPGARTVAVGTITSPLYDQVAESGAADAIVRGDPEVLMPPLLELFADPKPGALPVAGPFEMHKGAWVNKKAAHVHDFDALPSVPYHLIPLEKYWYYPFGMNVPYATVFASRGCSYHCYYCPYPMGFGDKIVHRDPIRVVDEIEDVYRNRGVRAILFRDQVFTASREKTMQMCDEIIRRGLKIRWLAETRLDCVDKELLRKMRESGCIRLQFGMESGDEKLFEKVGKDDAKGKFELFLSNFELVERMGIAAHMFILVGLLGETWETVQGSIRTIQRLKPLTLQVAVVTPYPGTGLYDQAKAKGLLRTEDFSQFTGFVPVSRTEKMGPEELEQARVKIIKAHRRSIFWKKQRHLAKLTVRYTLNGELVPRLRRKLSARLASA